MAFRIDDETLEAQSKLLCKWIRDNAERVEKLFMDKIPQDPESNHQYVITTIAAVKFADILSEEFKRQPQKSIPFGLFTHFTGLKHLFVKAFNVFAQKYVFPVYKIMIKLKRAMYPHGFPKFHPLHLLLETHLDFCIAKKWRYDPDGKQIASDNYYINLYNLSMVVLWIFNTGIKECQVPIESEEYFQKLDDQYAKENKRERMHWSKSRISTKRQRVIVERKNNIDIVPSETEDLLDDVPELSPIHGVVHIDDINKEFINDVIRAAQGSIFPTNVIKILANINELVTCVTNYWAFVFEKISSIMTETNSGYYFLYNTCSSFNSSTLNDYLLVIENDPIKHFIKPFGFDQQKYESFLENITSMFFKEIVRAKELFQIWFNDGRKSIVQEDFEILKRHIDNFITKFEALTNQLLM